MDARRLLRSLRCYDDAICADYALRFTLAATLRAAPDAPLILPRARRHACAGVTTTVLADVLVSRHARLLCRHAQPRGRDGECTNVSTDAACRLDLRPLMPRRALLRGWRRVMYACRADMR